MKRIGRKLNIQKHPTKSDDTAFKRFGLGIDENVRAQNGEETNQDDS
jgi:hypothetical protein